jgi:hypothetical protein
LMLSRGWWICLFAEEFCDEFDKDFGFGVSLQEFVAIWRQTPAAAAAAAAAAERYLWALVVCEFLVENFQWRIYHRHRSSSRSSSRVLPVLLLLLV